MTTAQRERNKIALTLLRAGRARQDALSYLAKGAEQQE